MIPIQNIYYMLAYAFKELKQEQYKKLGTEEFENITDLLSEILIIALKKQIKNGFNKDYVNKQEELTTIRGKINITESIIPLTIKKHAICQYDEYTVNTYHNQIIKTTLQYLLHQKIEKERKKKIKKILQYLQDVDTLDIHNINWKIQHNKNNQTHELILHICHLIIEEYIPDQQSEGKIRQQDYEEERMHDLYERFIREYYRQEHQKLNPNASKIEWQTDEENMDKDQLPDMKTDITLTNNENQKILIIDAKYYTKTLQENYGKKTIRSNNLYQIFTYVKNKAIKERDYTVSGLLLYAKTDEEEQPEGKYHMSGNTISIKTLDLNQNFKEIRRQLDNIIDEYLAL